MTGSLFDLPGTPGTATAAPEAPQAVPATKHGIPIAAARRLEALGFMDPDTGATRSAKARPCEGCRRPVIRGLDDDWTALTVACDPEPLSAFGEAAAVLAGRKTFTLALRGGRYELDRRDEWRMRGDPAGTGRIDVLMEHKCGQKGQFEQTESNLRVPGANSASPDAPPPF